MKTFPVSNLLPLLRFVDAANTGSTGSFRLFANFFMNGRICKVTLEVDRDCKENRMLRQYTLRPDASQDEVRGIVYALCEAVKNNSPFALSVSALLGEEGGAE